MQEMVIYGVSFDMVGKQPIVLLKTVDSNKFLPIWIGHPEAAAILMKLQGASTPRPMTHDLLNDVLGELEVNCTRVSVTELRENTFYASITLNVNGREIEIDSRPSDALALAVRSGAPIFAAEDVIADSAIEFEHEVEDTEEVVEKFKDFLDNVTPEDFAGENGDEQRAAAVTRRLPDRRDGASARSTQPRDQRVEPDARGVGGLGDEARLGQAGDGVGLEHGELPGRAVEHQVDPREAGAAEAPVDRQRELLGAVGGGGVNVGRTGEARGPDPVARLEVVEGVGLRDRLDDRKRLGAVVAVQDADRQVAAVDMALEEHAPVVGEGGDERAGDVLGGAGELDPQRRALRGRLHDDRKGQALLDRRERLGGSQLLEGRLREGVEVRRRNPRLAHEVLGEHLVHAAHAGGDSGPGVGDPEQLEQLLHGPVLPVTAVHRDEGDVRLGVAQSRDEVGARVDRRDGVARGARARPGPGPRSAGRPVARATARP